MLMSPPPGEAPVRRISTTLRVGLGILVGGVLLWLLAQDLLLVFLAILLAALLRGLSEPLSKYLRLPPMLALAVVTLVLFGALLTLAAVAGPRLVGQGQLLYGQISGQFDHLRQQYGQTPWGRLVLSFAPQASEASKFASQMASAAGTTLGGLVTAFIVVVTALYFAISPELYLNGLVLLFPTSYRGRLRDILAHVGRTLQFWLLGQSIDMLVVFLFTVIGLMLLGVPLALALGVLAGLLTFIPYFGAIAAAVPAVLVALSVGWQTAAWTLLLFFIAHSVDGYLISPLVQRRTVHMPPALTILSMTILGGLAGPMGIVLAAPLAAAGLVLVREAYVEDVLHDDAGKTPVEATAN
jgi:predicted PurR-regulated permease PerM